MKSAATSLVALVRRRERLSFHLLVIAVLLIVALPASAGNGLNVKTTSPGNGQTVSGSVTWEVTVSSGNVDHVDFAIDGVVKWSENVAPWQFNGVAGGLNTTQLSDGTHQLTAKAFARNGKATGSSTVSVKVANAAPPAPPPPPPPPPPPTPPTSATLPSISGTPTVGQKLSASTGTWSGSTPMTYSYGWVRCASSGGNCSPISGAASVTYTQTSADAGSTIRVTVTATNGAGSATATSAATAAVSQAPSGPATGLGSSLPARMPESSGSRSIYVSTGGSDSNAGTLAAPVATLGKAFSLAQDGAIIYVRGGNYGVQLIHNRDFSPLNPVTLESYPGERASFVGQTAYTNAVLFDGVSGIRIRDVTFAARTNTNLKIMQSQHVEIDHVISRDSGRDSQGGQGLLVGGDGSNATSPTYSSDIQVWNSVFTNNGGTSTGWAGSLMHDHAIYLGGNSPNTSIRGGVDGYVIANCLFADSPAGLVIQLGGQAVNGIVTNNTFDNASAVDPTSAPGAQITLWATSGAYATKNNLIVNNIFSNSTGSAVETSLSQSVPNIVRNNLAFGTGRTAYQPLYGSLAGFTNQGNLTEANPLYLDRIGTYANPSTKDFHLQAGSPALGKAEPAYAPPFDATGAARPSSPALGAYQ